MDPRYHVAALREVRLLVSGAQSTHGVRACTATRSGEGESRDLTEVMLVASVVYVPVIAAVAAVVFVINQVHTVLQIIEGRAQLWITAMRGAESARVSSMSNQIIPISSIVIAPSFLGVAALTWKETKLSRSRLIVGDAI